MIRLDDLLLGPDELGANLSTTHLTELVTDIDALFERLAESQSSNETTGKHVSCTVGVDDLVVGELGDGEAGWIGRTLLDVGAGGRGVGRGDESRFGTLGDDDETRPGGVRLGVVGEGDGSLLKSGVLGLSVSRTCQGRMETHAHTGSSGVCSGFTLVSDQDVDVGKNLFELNLEELRNEWSAQVQDDSLALGAECLGDLNDGLDTVRQKVSLNVEELGRVDDRGDLGLGEVVRSEFLGGSKGGAQVSVVASNDDGASTSSGRSRLDLVRRVNTFGLVGLFQGLHEVVVTDRSNVGDRVGREDVL